MTELGFGISSVDGGKGTSLLDFKDISRREGDAISNPFCIFSFFFSCIIQKRGGGVVSPMFFIPQTMASGVVTI